MKTEQKEESIVELKCSKDALIQMWLDRRAVIEKKYANCTSPKDRDVKAAKMEILIQCIAELEMWTEIKSPPGLGFPNAQEATLKSGTEPEPPSKS